jgi:hypothetical protein
MADFGQSWRNRIQSFSAQIPDHRHRALLRACGKWPNRRAAESGDEFAPSKVNPHLPLPCQETLLRQNITPQACSLAVRRRYSGLRSDPDISSGGQIGELGGANHGAL